MKRDSKHLVQIQTNNENQFVITTLFRYSIIVLCNNGLSELRHPVISLKPNRANIETKYQPQDLYFFFSVFLFTVISPAWYSTLSSSTLFIGVHIKIIFNLLHRMQAAKFLRSRPGFFLTRRTFHVFPTFRTPMDLHSQQQFDADVVYGMVTPIVPSDAHVSCTTFDVAGNVIAVSKKYPKATFLKENNLFPRDLRKVDSSSIDVVPSIMVRRGNAIVVNLLHIKAIIQRDNVKVFDTSDPSAASKLGLFMYDLEMKLKMPSTMPYEFKVLESILISILSYLEAELHAHVASCGMILSELEDHVNRESLQQLLIKLKKLASFHQRAALIRDVLEELLDNDEDLNDMYLTTTREYSDASDYSDVEMILETYYKHCDEVVQQAGLLISDIRATEEIVNIILDANRNSLMLFELKVTIYTLGVTVATLVPALYGMNLQNHIEESNYGFAAVVTVSIMQGIFMTLWNFRRLHRVQRLTKMSNSELGTPPMAFQTLHSPYLWFSRRWWSRLFRGDKTRYHTPTSKERDVIWRMIKDDKPYR